MKGKFLISGNAYNKKKWKLKKIQTKHKIKWVGSDDNYDKFNVVWKGRNGSIIAFYEQNETTKYLESAIFYIEMHDEIVWDEFYEFMMKICEAKELEWDLDDQGPSKDDMKNEEIHWYIATSMPNIRDLMIRGAPEPWIRHSVREFLVGFRDKFQNEYDGQLPHYRMLRYECPNCGHYFGNVVDIVNRFYIKKDIPRENTIAFICKECKTISSPRESMKKYMEV